MNKLSNIAKAAHKQTAVPAHGSSNHELAVVIVGGSSTQPTAEAPLTATETERLVKCEEVIRKGLKSFHEVYEALQDICDQRLYRSKYATFDAYCRQEWQYTARHVNRLMQAGECVANLKSDQLVSSVLVAIPENEAQARALAPLSPPQQIAAARTVAKKPGKPTTQDFQDAADAVTLEKPRVTMAGKSSSPKSTPGKASMESLIEAIDEVQTMVRVDRPKQAIMAKLKVVADLATHINNGGRVC